MPSARAACATARSAVAIESRARCGEQEAIPQRERALPSAVVVPAQLHRPPGVPLVDVQDPGEVRTEALLQPVERTVMYTGEHVHRLRQVDGDDGGVAAAQN